MPISCTEMHQKPSLGFSSTTPTLEIILMWFIYLFFFLRLVFTGFGHILAAGPPHPLSWINN
jgi:hypothetical protein